MMRRIRPPADLLISLLVAFALAACSVSPAPVAPPSELSTSSTESSSDLLSIAPEVKVGRLANGFSYYIRPNHRPERRAELWLVVDAGSVQEDKDQQGLAHFIEHMAFNGTRHFEKQELVDYLESIGMRFGPDLNAYTSFDETVYMLRVPTDDPEIVDTAFQILEDWAHGITLESEEVDKERGVLVEEWRLGRGAQARLRDQLFPVLFQGSKYAERLPIGLKEVIENAPHDALRRFYQDWYRPSLMALVAVGDFDPAEVEKKIQHHFGTLQDPPAPRPRETPTVPDHSETRVAIATDPEATNTRIELYTKSPKGEEGTRSAYRRGLVERLFHQMLGARLQELTLEEDPPYIFAGSASSTFIRSKEVTFQAAGVRSGELPRAFEALLRETERVRRHGFLPSELERTKKEVLRRYEQAYEERDKLTSRSLADEYKRSFLTGESAPGLEAELEMVREMLPTIELAELDALADLWGDKKNRVILVRAPENEASALPTEETLLTTLSESSSEEVAPYVDRVKDAPLLASIPTPGDVREERAYPEVGVTEWQLSNGVRVILKPTDFKNDQILLGGFSPGGHSLAEDAQHTSAAFADLLVQQGGLGEFGPIELSKALAGKVASASTYINELEEGVRGNASPQDLQTLFELVYLLFTEPRIDPAVFTSFMTRAHNAIANRLADPATVFQDKLTVTLAQGHPRRRPMSPELLDELDLDVAFEIYRQRFADASDFTFVLVGNFAPEDIRSQVETYLGGLPSSSREESWRDVGVEPPSGIETFKIQQGLEPKSQVHLVFSKDATWDREKDHALRTLGRALNIRLREIMREDKGATYGVGVWGSIERRPRERASLNVSFSCSPDNVDELIETVFDTIRVAQTEGLGEVYLAKTKEAQLRKRETDLRENSFWISVLQTVYKYGIDPGKILEYEALVESVDEEGLRETAKRYLDLDRYVLGVLYPEAAAEESH